MILVMGTPKSALAFLESRMHIVATQRSPTNLDPGSRSPPGQKPQALAMLFGSRNDLEVKKEQILAAFPEGQPQCMYTCIYIYAYIYIYIRIYA